MTSPLPHGLGIVIPTLDEAEVLPLLLEDLTALRIPAQIVVSDGGSRDGTPALARARGARVLHAQRGRAHQMNAGARALDTPWLLFLHADSRLPPATLDALERWLATPSPSGAAHFGFSLDASGPWWRVIERGQRVRERLFGRVYGDQGLLVARTRFEAVGGFPELPLMEDVEIVRALRREGGIERIDAPIATSARRYREEGPFLGWLRNATLLLLHSLGVHPDRLARWYPPRQSPGTDPADAVHAASPRRILLVFARAPRRGEVKTRLAAELGEAEALRIYRAMGGGIVDALRRGPWRTVIYYTPAEAEGELRDWLGPEGLSWLPQCSGGLGERLAHGFQEGFRAGDRICAVGTDAPGLTPHLVAEAFERIEDPNGPEVVLGPAHDGGYYLVALRAPAPELFEGIPWSTDRTLAVTLERALALGLGTELLSPLADVDRPDDVPRELLRAGPGGADHDTA